LLDVSGCGWYFAGGRVGCDDDGPLGPKHVVG
jgi:hypothetical protein